MEENTRIAPPTKESSSLQKENASGEGAKSPKSDAPKSRKQLEFEEFLSTRNDDVSEDIKAILGSKNKNGDNTEGDMKAEKLPQEIEEGNVEYKLKLVNPSPERLAHLVTQMKWRLNEGVGEAIYEIGVEDDGVPTGLSPEELESSLQTLEKMSKELNADMTVIRTRDGVKGKVAEVLVRRFASEDFLEIRVAIVGNVDSGKSTLLVVLTRGQLDNGRGLARNNVFVHKHEIETGRTSSISHEILGFDSKGRVVNYMGVKGMSMHEICESSSKIVNFIDLAGHEKYLKTTVFGLTGHAPDFAQLMVGANMGVSMMTKEHLGISLALKVPVYVVVTKIDMCPENILKETLTQIKKLLKSPGSRKIPIVIRSEDDVVVAARNFVSERICPIFCVSNVTGQNLDLLRKFLNLLPARTDWEKLQDNPTEYHIDAIFSVPGVGTVVSGTLFSGKIGVNQTLLLGPDEFGKFNPAIVKSIHSKRVPVRSVKAGQTAALALKKLKRSQIRKGMVMVEPTLKPLSCREFEAEILVLYHSTTISPNYQAVVHCGVSQQTAKLLTAERQYLRTGDKAKVRFRFMYWPEYVREGEKLIFREGRTKGIGRVLRIIPEEEELGEIPYVKKRNRKQDAIVNEHEELVEKQAVEQSNGKTEEPIPVSVEEKPVVIEPKKETKASEPSKSANNSVKKESSSSNPKDRKELKTSSESTHQRKELKTSSEGVKKEYKPKVTVKKS